MLLGGECLRDDVLGMPLAGALPLAPCKAALYRHRRCREGDVLQGHSTVLGSQHAYTIYVDARRPCTAHLGRRARKWHVRNFIAQSFTAQQHGASPNFTARNGLGVGEGAAKIVSAWSDRLEVWKFSDCECADTAYVGARRPCTALPGHRVCQWNARNVIPQTFTA